MEQRELIPLKPIPKAAPPGCTQRQLTERVILLKRRARRWIFQHRRYAYSTKIFCDITLPEMMGAAKDEEYMCVYCGRFANSFNRAFPRAPYIQANIVPSCTECDAKKSTNNIISFCINGGLTREKLHGIMSRMLKRHSNSHLREYLEKNYLGG